MYSSSYMYMHTHGRDIYMGKGTVRHILYPRTSAVIPLSRSTGITLYRPCFIAFISDLTQPTILNMAYSLHWGNWIVSTCVQLIDYKKGINLSFTWRIPLLGLATRESLCLLVGALSSNRLRAPGKKSNRGERKKCAPGRARTSNLSVNSRTR